MKNIVLSFDDGRWDTYERALPVLSHYGLVCTINVISDFVLHPEHYHLSCCKKGSMTKQQVLEAQERGMEIACHGQKHKNDVDGIINCIAELNEMGVNTDNIGFASPESVLTLNNYGDVRSLKENGGLSYIRSGVQLKREGYLYAGLTIANRYIHSKMLFQGLNKRWMINNNQKYEILPSVSITSDIMPTQIQYLIEHTSNEQSVILMFHSILNPDDPGYGDGIWFWDCKKFEDMCAFFRSNADIDIITTHELLKRNHLA